jgi:hypothetical protein
MAGVLGVTLGRFWDGRSEATRWHRDQKAATYQRFAEAFGAIYENVRTVALAEPDTSALADAVTHARRDRTWENAMAAVWLHGSAAVVTACTALDREVISLFHDVQTTHLSVTDWNQARLPSARAFETFVEAARDELKLQRVPILLFTHAPPRPESGSSRRFSEVGGLGSPNGG